jgi:hypothetical protein
LMIPGATCQQIFSPFLHIIAFISFSHHPQLYWTSLYFLLLSTLLSQWWSFLPRCSLSFPSSFDFLLTCCNYWSFLSEEVEFHFGLNVSSCNPYTVLRFGF